MHSACNRGRILLPDPANLAILADLSYILFCIARVSLDALCDRGSLMRSVIVVP